MKTTKKIGAVMLTLCLVFTMVLGNCSIAHAESVFDVTITTLPLFVKGEAIADAQIGYELPEGYKATTQWKAWDRESEEYKVVTDGKFTETDVYHLSLLVEAEAGYTLPGGEINVNCEEEYEGVSYKYDDNNNLVAYDIEIGNYTFATEVTKVDISVPEVKVGDIASLEKASIVLYTGDSVVDMESLDVDAKWINEATGVDVTGKTFEMENAYQLDIAISLEEGYSFSKYAEVLVNGNSVSGTIDPDCVNAFPTFPLFSPIERVYITNLPQVKAGEELSTDFTMDCSCGYCGVLLHWHDEKELDVTNVTAVAGKTYIMCLHCEGYDGVTLADNFVFVIDGKEYKPTSFEDGEAVLELEYAIPAAEKKPLAVGKKKASDDGKATYKVTTSDLKKGTVTYVAPKNKKATKVSVPDTAVIDGVTYKVTAIAKNAFKNNKKIKSVTIGKNVKTIGSKAFYGCKKVKTLTIKSTKLTTKKIGSKAFAKTPKSMTVKVAKKKYSAYKKMLIKSGVNKKAKFKKLK